MRRLTTALTLAALALAMQVSLGGTPARAAVGYDSAYQFESAFLALNAGDSGTFAVFFSNVGSTAWVKNTASQVNLAICAQDKVTCNVASPNAAFAMSWLSPTAYSTAAKDVVAPGDFSSFTYAVKVPNGQPTGTYRFNGDLVLATTGERVHPEGYFHDLTVQTSTPLTTLSIAPDFGAIEDNEVSSTVPGIGQHTYTVTTSLTGSLSLAILDSANIVKNADGTFGFCDKNQDKKADGVGAGSTLFTAINGISTPPAGVLINQAIPGNGSMTVTIDSATRNQRVRVVAWQDKSQNSQIDLTATGADTTCNTFTPYDLVNDGAMAVSGRKLYLGPKGQFGVQFPDGSGNAQCEPVWLHDNVNQLLSAGPLSSTSLRYTYDSNDTFELTGTRVTLDTFKATLVASTDGTGSTIKISYDPNAAGFSSFSICQLAGANAPSNLSAATGNFDNGSLPEDVRLTMTAPTNNNVTTYNIQRASVSGTATTAANSCNLNAIAPNNDTSGAPTGSAFSSIGAITITAGQTGTFTNFDLSDGGYCYRVMVQNPNIGTQSFSNYVPVNIPGTSDVTAPRSTSANLSQSGGLRALS